MNKIAYVSAALLFAAATVAQAQTTPPAPVSQGAASVNKNLAKDPDNKGLQTASEQLKENEAKIAAKRTEQTRKRETHSESTEASHAKTERSETMERHEKVERPARMERPGR